MDTTYSKFLAKALTGDEHGWVHAVLPNGEYPKTVQEVKPVEQFEVEFRVSQFTGVQAVMIRVRKD